MILLIRYKPFSLTDCGSVWSLEYIFWSRAKSLKTCSNEETFSWELILLMKAFSTSLTIWLTLRKEVVNYWLPCQLLYLQRSVILLHLARLSPAISVASVVKCTDEALSKWQKACWGHCLLLKVTWTQIVIQADMAFASYIHGGTSWALWVLQERVLWRVWVAKLFPRLIDPENDILKPELHCFTTWQMLTHCLFLRV